MGRVPWFSSAPAAVLRRHSQKYRSIALAIFQQQGAKGCKGGVGSHTT